MVSGSILFLTSLVSGDGWKQTRMQNVFVVECCESEIAVVSDVMTHREHVHHNVFCPSYWKKKKNMLNFWLFTLEVDAFTPSWMCQTDRIQAITHKTGTRPLMHPYKVTLYSIWDRRLHHPQWSASCLLLLVLPVYMDLTLWLLSSDDYSWVYSFVV